MKKNIYISFTLLFFIITSFTSFANADQPINKKYHYNLYWSGIKAGEATLEYVETPEGLAIRTHAVSSKFLSIFYKVDDRAETIIYPNGYPKSSTMKIREGRHRKQKATYFTHKTEENPQKIFFHDIRKDEKTEHTLDEPAHDPLSGFYSMTKTPMDVGKTEFIKIFDSNKIFDAEINVLKKENIRVPAGKFDSIMINPILKTEGLFLRKGKMYIWLTNDDKKVPIMFKSKVKIGSFIAKLVEEH